MKMPCENCRKCGTTVCGNDVVNYLCYEENPVIFSLWPCNVCKKEDKSRCDTDKQHFPCFVE